MEVESVLVTGANRGIGLEFVKQLIQLPKPPTFVFATYRNPETLETLEEIKNTSNNTQVILIKMDVTKPDEVQSAKKVIDDILGDKGLNLLINNAGAVKLGGFPKITEENLIFHFHTNTVGPVTVLKEMFPLLQKSASRKTTGLSVSRAAVINISSLLGSILALDENQRMTTLTLKMMGYRISKAALNMAMRVVALTVKDDGILVVNICPGWVKTDLGSQMADLEASESISDMLKTLPKLNESHHGAYLDRNGNTIAF